MGARRHDFATFDPLLGGDGLRRMVELAERFGTFRTYGEEPTFPGLIGEGLPARWDAARNFLRTGGRFGREEPLETLAARTNYFRETYAYGEETRLEGVEPFLHHAGFVEAAKRIHGATVIEPAIVYANLLVPGQELAVHTDVPEFRGVNRKRHPQWLLVAMHHSGLFDAWRMPIATGVAWFSDGHGGAFAFYPDGPDGDPVACPVRADTAILLDTDSVFHGVDRVAPTEEASEASVAHLGMGRTLRFLGEGLWGVFDGERELVRHRFEDLRYSVSWKAYCFRDSAERDAWRGHAEDLSVEAAVDRLVEDLRDRGRIGVERPPDPELVEVIIDTHIRFPAARPETESPPG